MCINLGTTQPVTDLSSTVAFQMKIIKTRKGDGGVQVEQYLKNKEEDGQFLIKISPRTSYSYFSMTV